MLHSRWLRLAHSPISTENTLLRTTSSLSKRERLDKRNTTRRTKKRVSYYEDSQTVNPISVRARQLRRARAPREEMWLSALVSADLVRFEPEIQRPLRLLEQRLVVRADRF